MYEEFCIKQRKRADEHLAEFLAANPAYSLDQERPDWLKGTHLVAFGAYREQAVVFKYYDIMTDGTEVTAFIDLEMTRSGNEILLLGAALLSVARRPECWPAFQQGYEDARGTTISDDMLALMRCAAPFSTWIRFTWYWSTNDLPWWARETSLRTSAARAIQEDIAAVEQTKR